MATNRTTTKLPKSTTPDQPADCQPCGGSGYVPTTTVRVGRKRRTVGQQDGLCRNCFGFGTNPSS